MIGVEQIRRVFLHDVGVVLEVDMGHGVGATHMDVVLGVAIDEGEPHPHTGGAGGAVNIPAPVEVLAGRQRHLVADIDADAFGHTDQMHRVGQ